VMCGGSILSCCPRNSHGHERALKEEEKKKKKKNGLHTMKRCMLQQQQFLFSFCHWDFLFSSEHFTERF